MEHRLEFATGVDSYPCLRTNVMQSFSVVGAETATCKVATVATPTKVNLPSTRSIRLLGFSVLAASPNSRGSQSVGGVTTIGRFTQSFPIEVNPQSARTVSFVTVHAKRSAEIVAVHR